MSDDEDRMNTESEKTSSCKYVKKTAIQLKIKCRIEEFEVLMAREEELYSEGVSSELATRAVWVLEVYPNGRTRKERGNISVYLSLTGPMADDGQHLDATYHLYLLDGTGGKIDSIDSGTHEFEGGGPRYGGRIRHGRTRRALHADGSLVVAADINFFAPDDSSKSGGEGGWPTRFSEFYGDAATSDCTIQIGDAMIPAHKPFLMACSPAFRVMFSNPSAESKSGVIEISDFHPGPVRAMIRYCYEGHIDAATLDEERAVEIFKLADKYLIDDLKAELEDHFIDKRLCVENVIKMVVFADTYSAKKLKEACTKLIAREADTIFDSAEWKELKKARPEFTTDLAVAAFRKK